MEADIFTKPIIKPDYWTKARKNISIAHVKELVWEAAKQLAAMPCVADYHRMLLEFCCSEDSLLGQPTSLNEGCKVVRLTEAHDMTTETGYQFACDAVDEAVEKGVDIELWSSIPCTGGSPWQNINKRHANARKLIRSHIILFNKLWNMLVRLVNYIIEKSNGKVKLWIAIEWPKGCSYWRLRKVIAFVNKHNLTSVLVNGCRVNLRSIVNNKLIAKPWSIKTNSPELMKALGDRACNHPSSEHQPCAGKDTKR
jgi:hypothetical protein